MDGMHDSYPDFTPDIYDEAWLPHQTEILGSEGHSYGPEMVGVDGNGQSFAPEIGGVQVAIRRTIVKARDNRRPAPTMRAVSVDNPGGAAEIIIGMCGGPGEDLFPALTAAIEKYAGGSEGTPRIVRMDTPESYQAFRASDSPARGQFMQRLIELEQKVAAHLADPQDIEEVTALGAEVQAIEAEKQIPLRMPRHFNGKLEAWHENGVAGASMVLPRADGGIWICTACEPIENGVLEAARAATEAGVRAAEIVGYLPAIGASLAQANAMKALAAGAESVLQRPEAKGAAPFVVRLEPKTSPALYAIAEVAKRCLAGDSTACGEWDRLAAAAPPPVRQAMAEIMQAMKAPPTVLGGVGDFFRDAWEKVRRFFGGLNKPPALPPATATKMLPAKATA